MKTEEAYKETLDEIEKCLKGINYPLLLNTTFRLCIYKVFKEEIIAFFNITNLQFITKLP